jgi:phosphoserine phosphatase
MTQQFLLKYLQKFKTPLKDGLFEFVKGALHYRFLPYNIEVIHQYIIRLLQPNYLEIDELVEEFCESVIQKSLYLPAIEELKRASHLGKEVLILSTSPSFLVAPIAKLIGVNFFYATEYQYDIESKSLILSELIHGQKKKEIAEKIQAEMGFEKDQLSAYTDSIQDLLLLDAVGFPVAVNPDPALKRIARNKGWRIL